MTKLTAHPVNSPIKAASIQSGDEPRTNTVWRFYTTEDHKWKWQRLSVRHEVIAESSAAYKDYDSCLADAKKKGHDFLPSQTKKISAAPQRVNAK